MSRVRIKICGLTREADVAAAVAAGADAVGFVCYAASPRYVARERLAALAAGLPPFVTPVLLFVNAAEVEVRAALAAVPQALLQFHGDETEAECGRYGRPYLRALRMGEGADLLDCETRFASAAGLLADAPAAGYGGGGRRFDWSRIPPARRRGKPLVLAGGLDSDNVGAAIAQVEPYAVDVSSGVEVAQVAQEAKGIKDAARIAAFVAAVRAAERRGAHLGG